MDSASKQVHLMDARLLQNVCRSLPFKKRIRYKKKAKKEEESNEHVCDNFEKRYSRRYDAVRNARALHDALCRL
jgi:hypothetical protein